MTARVLSWDWRAQPDLDQLAAAIHELSGGRLHLRQVNTGSDEYAIALADDPITDADANRIYEEIL